MWGGQFCLAILPAAGSGRLKGGCGQGWPPHKSKPAHHRRSCMLPLQKLKIPVSAHAGCAQVVLDDEHGTDAYLGMTTGLVTPGFVKTIWSPSSLTQ
jgi:hypothetical protein